MDKKVSLMVRSGHFFVLWYGRTSQMSEEGDRWRVYAIRSAQLCSLITSMPLVGYVIDTRERPTKSAFSSPQELSIPHLRSGLCAVISNTGPAHPLHIDDCAIGASITSVVSTIYSSCSHPPFFHTDISLERRAMAPHPVNSQVTFVDQARCASPNCRRTLISRECTNKMCKACCVDLGTPCAYNPHSKARRTLANLARTAAMASILQLPVPADGFTMARPDAISPPLLHSNAILLAAPSPSPSAGAPSLSVPLGGPPSAVSPDLPISPPRTQVSPAIPATTVSATHVQASSSPKRFRKLMSSLWQSQWDESQKRKKELLAGEEALRIHREKLAKSVVVWFWRQVCLFCFLCVIY